MARADGLTPAQARRKYAKSVDQMAHATNAWVNKDLRREMTRASREAAKKAVPAVKQEAPVDTGKLSRQVYARATKTQAKIVVGRANSSAAYVRFVNYGTKAFPPNKFIARGISDAWNDIVATFKAGHDRVAKQFNISQKQWVALYKNPKSKGPFALRKF